MGGESPATTQQTSKVELPAWVDQASQENYALAKDISNRPLQQYGGQTVAAPSAMTTQGYGLLQKNVGTNDPAYQQAQDLFTKSTGPLDIAGNLNPYTNEVEQRAIDNANLSLQQQLRGVSDTARKAGAFGGSRSAVESGVTRGEGIRSIGDLSANLRKQGFDVATQNALAQQAGMRAGATGLVNTAGSRQASQMQDVAGLLGAGGQQQAQSQAEIDALMKQFYEKRDYPLEGLNTRLAALGMSPYGKTETSNKTATAEKTGPDWATIGLGALKSAPGIMSGISSLAPLLMMSDRETKTDIKKLTGGDIPIYAYRYKGDPKDYPKIIGPMAQDIEKKYPSAVKKVGRYKTVDINNLMEVLS